jgi:uncharacterized protein YecE (DUF72 family)
MATRLHIGAKELRGDISAYAKRFGLLEVMRGGTAAPTVATLKRWRKNVPPAFEFVVVGGKHMGGVKPSADLDHDLKEAIEAINALEARCFLLRTHADVRPSKTWRDRMAQLLERLPRDATQIAWEPRGVWEIDDATNFAKKLGVTLVVDASRDALPPGPLAYIRLPAMGETRGYASAALERVAERIGERREAYVIFETDAALTEAKRLRRLSAEAHRGSKPVKRIRARSLPLRVRDDEQE